MILLKQLTMSFGQKLLFYNVDLNISGQKKYALVGANGSGKSTLLKLITNEEKPISGEIATPKEMTIGWLKQDQFRYEDTPLTAVVIQGNPRLWQAMKEKEDLLESTAWNDKLVKRLSHCEDTIAQLDGYSAEAFAEKLLVGLGIHSDYHHQPLSALSGGFKLRVLLAQALFQKPNILLLDEPTNHLDILSIRWLEKYLKNEFKGLLLFISHDIEFINRLADHILDIDYGEIRQYSGQYERFLIEKKALEEQEQHRKMQAEQRIADMQRFVDRFSAGTRARQAQAKAKMIEKLELPDVRHSSRIQPHFSFKIQRPSGKQVLKVQNLTKRFGERTLFQNLHLQIMRGEKVAIIGQNGIGKSTLIKILLQQIGCDEGSFEWGYETHLSYFSQDHHDLLKTHQSILEWLSSQITEVPEQSLRKTLGQALFRKEEVDKDILTLSGGEAARLLLARIILEASNVLVLDEPTNHLDIESTESLATALKLYPGTLIFVSHDRHFISKIANRVLYITQTEGVQDFKGDFVEFEKRNDL